MLKLRFVYGNPSSQFYQQVLAAFGEPVERSGNWAEWPDVMVLKEEPSPGAFLVTWWAKTAEGQIWLEAHQPPEATTVTPATAPLDSSLGYGRQP